MKAIKVLLTSILYIASALMVALLLAVGVYAIKPFLDFSPSKQTLQLSEIVVRSKEVVTSYWQKYQQCPTDTALTLLKELSLVEQVIVKSGKEQCELTIKLDQQHFNHKEIRLLFQFTRTQQPTWKSVCYTNTSPRLVSSSCANMRDLDSLNR